MTSLTNAFQREMHRLGYGPTGPVQRAGRDHNVINRQHLKGVRTFWLGMGSVNHLRRHTIH